MKKVMFVCKHNSRRSQMTEGFAHTFGENKIAVTSSGLAPSEVDPITVEVMAEIDIDISNQTSKPLNDFNAEDYDAVISLCGCGVNLPEKWVLRDVFEDWQLDDPAEQSIEVFRRIRDEVKQRVVQLIESLS
ncbi:arsenate reductase, glutathione/glutaredoxin type [Nostoc sp. CHAB 5824]|nr:arsenate reductase, glutathione/glutaredoxin type [Nostoc sp. CHAB 5824]